MVWIATALNQVDGELNVISALLLAVYLVVCLVRNSHDSVKIQIERHLLWVTKLRLSELTLILRRSHMGTVWFYTSTSNKRAAQPKLYTKSLTRDLKLMYSCLTLVRISINL